MNSKELHLHLMLLPARSCPIFVGAERIRECNPETTIYLKPLKDIDKMKLYLYWALLNLKKAIFSTKKIVNILELRRKSVISYKNAQQKILRTTKNLQNRMIFHFIFLYN